LTVLAAFADAPRGLAADVRLNVYVTCDGSDIVGAYLCFAVKEGIITSAGFQLVDDRTARTGIAVHLVSVDASPQAGAPNAVWCADFKGHFRTRDGARCDPLTISDGYSRYLIDCHIVARLTTVAVRERFLRAFAEHGMPATIHTDNGVPFAGSGVAGLSRLAVEWVKAGITLERSRPGHPQDNGRHERMHRTLKAETASPPATDRVEQQRRFDRFRAEYNYERPHQALGQLTPAALYQPSARRWPARLEDPWYDADHQVRRVRREGEIKWMGQAVFVSEALSGELLGIRELPWGDYLVRFANLELGLIRPGESRLRRIRAHAHLRPDAALLLPQLSSMYPV
jgi:transposase InsO family protein